MARINIRDLEVDHTITRQELKMILGGTHDNQILQFSLQQETQNLTRYLTMMSNISSAWNKTLDNIVSNTK